MKSIGFYCDANRIEKNALEQLRQYAERPYLDRINAYPDIHFCQEKALPVGVAFETTGYCYPLITGKDIGCGVMYLSVNKEHWIKPFNKEQHYRALELTHHKMTDEGLGGGNHFLSIEEDKDRVYVLCHTGTRNRGIALYQDFVELIRKYSNEQARALDYVPVSYLSEELRNYYQSVLEYGYERRKAFCMKTLIFLQKAGYVRCRKEDINPAYLQENFRQLQNSGSMNGTPYQLEDSIHNHLRFEGERVLHRKGSTEIRPGRTVVIPLSMSRGSLLVKADDTPALAAALYSCSHGAGRKLSRFSAMKYWSSTLKEKQRKAYRLQFPELLNRSGDFPAGYIQEFDFAYKSSEDLLVKQLYLKLVTKTSPIVTVKYSEI
ncbi:RtcB family protein [Flavihumibacter sp. CACIAM 22H1]|uniref:RtcB family protein n=1 Tax=Flavihumibacter sp. CACIAM 22H1 TaxID=1812911 RepID=UPI0007A84CD3|nr:RtcB family protein [Flavihumibacter sp. CACIAM 22H1]KYP13616.1 MAG: hypothetical protein A1D16_08465 [Flavihumibacter sp. CACIAM 22H1]